MGEIVVFHAAIIIYFECYSSTLFTSALSAGVHRIPWNKCPGGYWKEGPEGAYKSREALITLPFKKKIESHLVVPGKFTAFTKRI